MLCGPVGQVLFSNSLLLVRTTWNQILPRNEIAEFFLSLLRRTTARRDSCSVKQRAVWTTENTARHPRGAIRPSLANLFTLFEHRGRRADRVAACTRGARATNCAKSAFTTGTGGISRPSLRSGFTAYGALSSVNLADCHRDQRDASRIVADVAPSLWGARTTRFRRPPLCRSSQAHQRPPQFRTTFRDDA